MLRRVTTDLAEQDIVVMVASAEASSCGVSDRVLPMQVVAPEDVRLERVMECSFEQAAGPLTRDQARDLLRHRDRESAAYIRYLFHVDWLDPHTGTWC